MYIHESIIYCCGHNFAWYYFPDCITDPRPWTLEVRDSLVVLKNPECHGTESMLVECEDEGRCQTNRTAGVICRAGNTVFQSSCIPDQLII